MALVHSQTPKSKPEDQMKGIYQITPFEVQAWLRGESLNTKDYGIVHAYYAALGTSPPAQNKEPALTDVPAASSAAAVFPKRLVKPAPTFTGPLESLRQIAKLSVATLPDDDAWEVLVSLAKRFNLEIE